MPSILDSVGDTNISLTRVLLLFYITIASHFTGGLVSTSLKEYIENSRLATHIIGFILMLVLIMVVGGITNIEKAILYAAIAYLWFILTTKMDITFNIIILALLIGGFLYETKLINDEEELKKDNVLTEKEKEKINEERHNYKKYIFVSILIVTVIGTFVYGTKKYIQVGGSRNFDIMTYLFY